VAAGRSREDAEQRADWQLTTANRRGDHPRRHARSPPGRYADRTPGLIAILWRAGLRISEALALTEPDLDPTTDSVLVRSGTAGDATEPA
jgi:integrase